MKYYPRYSRQVRLHNIYRIIACNMFICHLLLYAKTIDKSILLSRHAPRSSYIYIEHRKSLHVQMVSTAVVVEVEEEEGATS